MRVLSLNVWATPHSLSSNGWRADRLSELIYDIEGVQPDVLLVQEAYTCLSQKKLREAMPHGAFGKNRYLIRRCGVGALSKEEADLEESETFHDLAGSDRWTAKGIVKIAVGDTLFYSTHMNSIRSSGASEEKIIEAKLSQLSQLYESVVDDMIEFDKIVIGGDFNLPRTDIPGFESVSKLYDGVLLPTFVDQLGFVAHAHEMSIILTKGITGSVETVSFPESNHDGLLLIS